MALAGVLPGGPYYNTNDDVAMRLLSEGQFAPGAGPTPYLMFMNIVIGWALASLYTLADGIPWYDLLMTATTLIASAAFVFVWTAPNSAMAGLKALLLGAFFLMPLFATPQFSLTGMTCAAAGGMMLARPLIVPVSAESRRRHLVLGGAFLVWGALIRWEGAALILCQAVLCAIAARLATANAREIGPVWPVARAAATAAALMGLAFVVHTTVYRLTPGWNDFAEFNLVRARLTEYASSVAPSPAALSALRESTGWSGNDLELLRAWFFEDASVFSIERLYTAQTVLAGQSTGTTSALISAAGAVRGLFVANWTALGLLACVALASSRPAKSLVVLAIQLGIVLLLLLGITAAMKEPPFRVYWPMFVLTAGFLPASESPSHPRPLAAVALLAAAAVLAVTMTERWRIQERHQALANAVAADVAMLRSTGARFVAIQGPALPWEFFWRPFRRAEFGVPFIAIGASVRTPPIQAALRRQGYPAVVQGLCGDGRHLLIARQLVLPKLVAFMAEHHHRTVSFEPALTGRTFSAWRCR